MDTALDSENGIRTKVEHREAGVSLRNQCYHHRARDRKRLARLSQGDEYVPSDYDILSFEITYDDGEVYLVIKPIDLDFIEVEHL